MCSWHEPGFRCALVEHIAHFVVGRTLEALFSRAPEVEVRYDPANPRRAVLSIGIRLHHVARILAARFVACAAVILFRAVP